MEDTDEKNSLYSLQIYDYPLYLSSQYFDFSSRKQQSDSEMMQIQEDIQNEVDEEFPQKSQNSSNLKKKISKQKKKKDYLNLQIRSGEQQAFRQCLTHITKPISTPYLFLFTGNVIIDLLDHSRDSDMIESIKPLTVLSLTKNEEFYSAKPSFIEVCKEFDMAIYLLENKSSKLQYDTAQKLKQFKLSANMQTQVINKIKEKYQNNLDELFDLQETRAKYRNEQIDNYIKNNMTDDDFYVCFDYGVDFKSNSTNPHFIKFSKNVFALFGIDEQYIHLYLTKKDAFLKMVPNESRKLLTLIIMELQIQENKYKKFRTNGFQIQTIEGLQITCGLEAYITPVIYPPNYFYITNSQENLEDTMFIKFEVTAEHLKYVLSQRQSATICPYYEDIEYSVFSEIFIQKFYPKEYQKWNKPAETEESVSKQVEEEKIDEEDINLQKTCGFRYIQ